MLVLPGNAGTAADEADVRLTTSVTDVRNASDLSDYTGELELRFSHEVTDRVNYPPTGGQGPATAQAADYFWTVPCAATGDTTVGATCDLTTTADAVLAGSATEGARAIWATGRVEAYDGGPDSDADTQVRATLHSCGRASSCHRRGRPHRIPCRQGVPF